MHVCTAAANGKAAATTRKANKDFFQDGVTILLQWLPEGQRLKVLQVSSWEDFVPDSDRVNSHLQPDT